LHGLLRHAVATSEALDARCGELPSGRHVCAPVDSSTSKAFVKTYRTLLTLTVIAAALTSGMAIAATSDSTAPVTPANAVRKTERVVSDSWITTKVKSEILANSGTKGFKVSVKTRFKTVTLKGKLPSQDAIDQVKQIAEKVKGVKSVDTSGLSVAAT
jgi:hyperosmotically inducible protein